MCDIVVVESAYWEKAHTAKWPKAGEFERDIAKDKNPQIRVEDSERFEQYKEKAGVESLVNLKKKKKKTVLVAVEVEIKCSELGKCGTGRLRRQWA